MSFPRLLSPLQLRSIRLPNRMIMGSMHLGFESAPDAFPRLAHFYAERAKGGIGLIVTGGVAPNPEGSFGPDGTVLANESQLDGHRLITDMVHAEGGRIAMQILHCGRYGKHPDIVAPSAIRAPISSIVPREMTEADILGTIAQYGRTAALAAQAGYDGVEVMASEGYLINEFLALRTNKRTDRWGGDLDGRMRFLLDIVRSVRGGIGPDLLMSARLSMVDLVEDGLAADEVVTVAKALEAEGVDIINSGIGWHEARVPTIAHTVPQGAWSWATARVKAAVGIPVAASNRIKSPELAEALLERGEADLVSMARPLLADPAFAAKVRDGRAESINACIGCNQGCLDPIFSGASATCLVNPRAGREIRFKASPSLAVKSIAVVGGGPAGMSCALEAARRGHQVTLFEAADELGGQFTLARQVPGKEEYLATPRYYASELAAAGANIRLGHTATTAELKDFDQVVLAAGIRPRRLDLPGADLPLVASYDDILSGRRQGGERVAILGSGGVGFDVALALLGEHEPFYDAWGIDRSFATPGGLRPAATAPAPPRRITMMQRKTERPGGSLGKTTGWIHKATLQRRGVEMLSGVTYERIDPSGIHILFNNEARLVEVDTIVVCIGQEPRRDLLAELIANGKPVHLIGGAREAARLDALAAFEEGTRLGLAL
ncbi:NADPH-dependent 2,4-dienoyl-CoA reductase [Paramagnetospirillum kuznetsovii]|uniref:NADPH-dependent 2,4-dienoyl-CoA reductase n=1 Tax=Paramagnetospirillum kuznetsovii TaxID=2053833 RepID=A0A364P250_9PROT|nr:NADPH-dependent 2,4-dienoyl-CoA reductase [Paramagnetospirillum kuznetsovii]RAU23391.1 NADPH-dependent 2,4-dienoyl-CoA reductase [Paramagnetospirillum kuznetsovii]